MMFICVNEECKQKCADLMNMNLHRQQIHGDKTFIAMENSAISLVEAVLRKHGVLQYE